MRIYELLDELKEEIENSPKSIFSNKRSIDPEVIIEIICDIKTALPDEVKEAESLVKEKNRILKKANEEATAIVASAEEELKMRVSEDRVVQEAEIKAAELLSIAEGNAREISVGAKEYADDILNEIEGYLSEYIGVIRKNRSELTGKKRD